MSASPAPTAPQRIIGVFDSGFGGLTVLRALLPKLPGTHFIYLGDTARLPYGAKSQATVARYAVESARFLVDRGAQLLVIACNTATALALPQIRTAVPVPVIGVVEPGAQAALAAAKAYLPATNVPAASQTVDPPASQTIIPASKAAIPASEAAIPASQTIIPASEAVIPASKPVIPASKPVIPASKAVIANSKAVIATSTAVIPASKPVISTGAKRSGETCSYDARAEGTSPPQPPNPAPPQILVLATAATVQSHAYRDACSALGLRAEEMPCPLLVPLVEEGWTDHPVTREVLRIYLSQALAQGHPRAVLLGCTHYPLIAPAIRNVLGDLGCDAVVVDSAEATSDAVRTALNNPNGNAPSATFECFATDSVQKFARLGTHFLGHPIPHVELLDLGG